MMVCKGFCGSYQAKISPRNSKVYNGLVKKCSICGVFLSWPGLRCPCCSNILRNQSRQKNVIARRSEEWKQKKLAKSKKEKQAKSIKKQILASMAKNDNKIPWGEPNES